MYQWDRAVFPPCVQFGDRVDKDDKVLILAFVKYLTAYQLPRSLRRWAIVCRLALTWVTFPRGMLLSADGE